MNLYQEAYGFTTLRVTVDVFEGWLGVVVLLVMVVGGLGYGRWLPRLALVTGAVAVLGLASINPDAWVAGRNIDRYEATGKLDIDYLQGLSARRSAGDRRQAARRRGGLRAAAVADSPSPTTENHAARWPGTWAGRGLTRRSGGRGLAPAHTARDSRPTPAARSSRVRRRLDALESTT